MTAVDESVTTEKDFYEYIGHHIRFYRERRGWSCGELGVEVGVSPRQIAGWEAGSSSLTVLGLCEIADAFGVDVKALLPKGGV